MPLWSTTVGPRQIARVMLPKQSQATIHTREERYLTDPWPKRSDSQFTSPISFPSRNRLIPCAIARHITSDIVFPIKLALLQHDAVHTGLHERVDAGDLALEQSQTLGDLDRDGALGQDGERRGELVSKVLDGNRHDWSIVINGKHLWFGMKHLTCLVLARE